MKNILLVEDSKEIVPMVKQAVGSFSELTWVKNISEAENALGDQKFSLILLDLNLPDGNGIDLCSKIYASSPEIPIFILTGSSDLSHKVLGFSAGADDYITKPFQPLELKARIESKLKKIDSLNSQLSILKWDDIEIIQSTQEVKIKDIETKAETLIDLTALEYKLLTYFANSPKSVFARDKILNDIWGENVYVYARSVDTHVSKLRKKLGANSYLIESVHGVGYKFSPRSS